MNKITITEDSAGARIDVWLSKELPDFSRSRVQRLIKDGLVALNGRPAKAGTVLKAGDVIEVAEEKMKEAVAPDAGLLGQVKVVEETDDFLVIVKPAGLLVHPAPKQRTATLVNFLLAHDPKIAQVGDSAERPGIVHRLDREASGLMVVAKNQPAYEHLKKQFQEHLIKKEYLALVYGKMSKDAGMIEASIGRKKGLSRMSARTNPQEGDKEAKSTYDVVERFPHATLVRVRTETGRMHQVRVHLKSLGHPLVGDTLYASLSLRSSPSLRPPRLFLHAAKLGFTDPRGEWREYENDLPSDLYDFLQTLQAKHAKK